MTDGVKTSFLQEKIKNFTKFRHVGVVFMFIASFLYSMNTILAKVITVGAFQITIFRVGFKILILIPILFKDGPQNVDNVVPQNKITFYLICRGFAGSTAGLMTYMALKHASPGLVTSITFLDAVIVPFLGRIFLRESLTFVDIVFAAVSFTGVILIAKPPFLFPSSNANQDNFLGVIFSICAALCSSCSYMFLRKIGGSISPLIPTLYFGLVGLITNFVLICITGEFDFPCWTQIGLLLLLACCGLSGVIFVTLALRTERPATTAVINTSQIVFVTLVQVFLLHDIPSRLSMMGSVLIFSTSISIGVRKMVNDRKNAT